MKLKAGDKITFRVPGLHPEPGHSAGPVDGVVVSYDEAERRVTVTCPLGHEHDVAEQFVIAP